MTCILCQSGLGMTKSRAVKSITDLRCYSCNKGDVDKEIALQEYDGLCPFCGKPMKPSVDYYEITCIKCGRHLRP